MRRFLCRIPVDIAVALIGLAGFALFLVFYDSAFPSANVRMTLSRGAVTDAANAYLNKMGYKLDGYHFVLTFGGSAPYFLQQKLGNEETNRLAEKEDLPFYYWSARWFKPGQDEEFKLYIQPDGKVVGFSHYLPPDVPGSKLEQKEAREIAEKYLKEDRGWDLSKWEEVSASSQDQDKRRDHSFQWKRKDFDLYGSELRLSIGIQGDKISSYDYAFRPPYDYYKTFSDQRVVPDFINNMVYMIGMEGISVIAIAILILPLLQGINPFRGVIKLSLLVTGVNMVSRFNSLFLATEWYWSSENWNLFWFNNILDFITYTFRVFLFVTAILAGGRYISRQVWKREDKILPRSPDRWATLARSSWRGLMLGGVSLGYVVLFYLVTTRLLGGWAPMDYDYSNGWATPLPFIYPLSSGLLAASQEEIIFRLVGISLLLWIFRGRKKLQWLALLIPGALWAFAHLTYVREPFYLRGIELLITSVFIEGLFFLYFDLTTTIVTHMSYNAILGALPMFRSGDPYIIFSGGLVLMLLLSPVLVGLARSFWLHRGKRIKMPHIRPVKSEDLDILLALPIPEIDWPALVQDPCAASLVLETGRQVIGAAAGIIMPEDNGQLLTVYVDPHWRNQFWGSKMVDEIGQQLGILGATSFYANVKTARRSSFAFLSTLGWQPTEQTLTRQTGSYMNFQWQRLRESWQHRKGAA